jgi:hypothetical protein
LQRGDEEKGAGAGPESCSGISEGYQIISFQLKSVLSSCNMIITMVAPLTRK